MTDAADSPAPDEDWPTNYFNYFTEVEERFQQARGTGLFLLSPLDWALIESWKSAGIPLSAVLTGIDEAFVKWHSRKTKSRLVNSLAYCAQAVAEAAKRAPERAGLQAAAQAPFAEAELRTYLQGGAERLRARPENVFHAVASSLDGLLADLPSQLLNLEDLERRLTVFEDKLVAGARTLQTDEDLYRIRTALDNELKPYRGKMTAEQLSALERRYLDSAILKQFDLPRLSLFYLH
jgi:hypothetical protein